MTASATPRFQDLPDVGSIADGEVVVRAGDLFVGLAAVLSGDLAAAVAALEAEIAAKQDSSSAATDIELAAAVDALEAALASKAELDAAVATVDAAIALKQDASTAATDAELAAAVATINTALAAKADASAVATDAELATHSADTTFVHGIADTTAVALVTDSHFPSTGEKAALAGTSGTPGSGNKYVTNGDARNTDARTPLTHSHVESDVTNLTTDLAAKQPLDSDLTAIAALSTTSTGRALLTIANAAAGLTALGAQGTSEKAQANGYASLDSGGKVPSGQIAAVALVTTSVVASQAAQLALTAQEGDVAVRSDESKTYIHNSGSAGTMADWTFLQTPASAVLSVNGQTGVVSLTYTDVGAASTSDSRLSDTRTPTDGSVTLAKVNTALKPSGSAASSDESLRALGSGATTAAAGNDARFPTSGQKNALAGTAGTPGTGNEYATKQTTDALATSVATKADSSTVATDAELAAHEADTTSIHGIANTANLILEGDSRLTNSRAPSGTAGGVLSGTYPNPGFAADMATQAELDAVSATVTAGLTLASREKWSNA